MKNPVVGIAVLALSLMLAGCATTNAKDPFEGFNRAMFDFNDGLDKVALKPAAEAYSTLPSFVQAGVENFFGNLGDVWTAVNNFLQGKPADGTTDVVRVLVNSTIGLGGLLDIASAGGITKHNEDFGQTLGVWGVESGPYLVLPFLGASTVRDTAALPADGKGDLWLYKDPVRWRNAGIALRVVDERAAVLEMSNLIEDAALDRYQFVRDAYLQRRLSKVYDGDPPAPVYDSNVD
jgi:phospholipid-binding lipoprotein MlaA